jgi:hypothetical protein
MRKIHSSGQVVDDVVDDAAEAVVVVDPDSFLSHGVWNWKLQSLGRQLL